MHLLAGFFSLSTNNLNSNFITYGHSVSYSNHDLVEVARHIVCCGAFWMKNEGFNVLKMGDFFRAFLEPDGSYDDSSTCPCINDSEGKPADALLLDAVLRVSATFDDHETRIVFLDALSFNFPLGAGLSRKYLLPFHIG